MKIPEISCVYSQQDVVETLYRFMAQCPSDEAGNEGALRFASELIGVSEDQMMEWMGTE